MLVRFHPFNFIIAAASVAATATVLARSNSSASRPSTVVVIDAGHGGFDRGGIPRQRIAEKTMTLDVALRLRNALRAQGYHVVMTRDSDVFVSLPRRVAIANSYRNAIFVCIHFNAATRVGANGIETYFYSRQSLPLASAIHYYVAGGAPTPNRGVRRRGYYVLRKTRIPAVLVECGFLTNPTEARYVLNATYRQKLADEIARGIGARSEVVRSSGSSRVAANEVPLQPFIDQTHYSHSHSHHHHHRRHHSSKKSSHSSEKSSSHHRKKSESAAKSHAHSKKTVSKKKKATSKPAED
jgi:N-acetylmuramoyl-L-alanine amidase